MPPIFVSGPDLDDRDFASWLAHQRGMLELPVTIAADGCTLGRDPIRVTGDVAPGYRWLAGRFVDGTFHVDRVGDEVTTTTPHARRAADPADLAIRALRPLHCARGSSRCEKCKRASLEPATPRLLDIAPFGDYARPTIRIDAKRFCTYDVIRVFADADEAIAFAAAHGIADVELGSGSE